MSKFSSCYPADGMMWCTFRSGKKAKPFPISSDYKKQKSSKDKKSKDDNANV